MSELKFAMAYFPLIGLILGLIAWGFINLSLSFFSKDISILLLFTLMMLLTGALHEDGLADAFDAFGSQFQKEDILRVMKDSRIGTFGTLAVVTVFFLKFTSLSEIRSDYIGILVCTAQVLSRWIILPMMLVLKYPYKSTSPSKFFVESVNGMPWWVVLMSSIFSIGISLLIFDYQALYLVLAVIAVGVLSGIYYYRKIQGATGDCLGTTQQISELIIYMLFLFLQ